MKIKLSLSYIKFIVLILGILCISNTDINAQGKDKLKNWHHLDYNKDKIHGVSTYQAYDFLKKKKSVPVVVAIIDSGVDIEHPALNNVIWVNKNEIPNNVDSDNNGYIDDINGWNFIGGKDGLNVLYDNLEITRDYRQLKTIFGSIEPTDSTRLDPRYKEYLNIKSEYDKVLLDAQSKYFTFTNIFQGIKLLNKLLQGSLNKESILINDITQENLNNTIIASNKDILSNLLLFKELLIKDNYSSLNEFISELQEAIDAYDSKIKFGLNLDFNPRCGVCDNYNDKYEAFYGNNNVIGPDPRHGTHVAGIIVAQDSTTTIQGIAKNVQLMVIRVVPDGDERDKDVANGIIYAVNNGAKVINMSFGKIYSSDKNVVDKAIKYAEKHDVVMVHAAGNDSKNLDNPNNRHYPTAIYLDKNKCTTWLEVGASSWKDNQNIIAPFSNYGSKVVDVLAPGLDIYSSMPNNKYKFNSGTSMAAPVVAGIAAVVRSYYPKLKAKQVVDIIKKSSITLKVDNIIAPANDGIQDESNANMNKSSINKVNTVTFKELSRYGIVNLYNAVELADKNSKRGFFRRLFSRD